VLNKDDFEEKSELHECMEVNRGSRRNVVPLTHRLRNLFKQTCLIIAAKATYLRSQLCCIFRNFFSLYSLPQT
jgi:hypothetical protein